MWIHKCESAYVPASVNNDNINHISNNVNHIKRQVIFHVLHYFVIGCLLSPAKKFFLTHLLMFSPILCY